MIYISHRGYINGVDEKLENNPDNITNLLKSDIHVEIDVRYHNDNFYLGHDEPKYKISSDFLEHKNLWCHAKDFKTLDQISILYSHNIKLGNENRKILKKLIEIQSKNTA